MWKTATFTAMVHYQIFFCLCTATKHCVGCACMMNSNLTKPALAAVCDQLRLCVFTALLEQFLVTKQILLRPLWCATPKIVFHIR